MDPRFLRDVTRALLWGPRLLIAGLIILVVVLILWRA